MLLCLFLNQVCVSDCAGAHLSLLSGSSGMYIELLCAIYCSLVVIHPPHDVTTIVATSYLF